MSPSDEIGIQWNTNQTHFTFLILHHFIRENYKIVKIDFYLTRGKKHANIFADKSEERSICKQFKGIPTILAAQSNSLQMIRKQSCERSKRLNSCQSSMGELVNYFQKNLMKEGKGTKTIGEDCC